MGGESATGRLKALSQHRLRMRNLVALLIQRGHHEGWTATYTAERILQELNR
jgi:hypothetical protein